MNPLPNQILDLFRERKWRPQAFQQQAWRAYGQGCSGLIHSSTGSGKTLAALLGPVIEYLGTISNKASDSTAASRSAKSTSRQASPPLTLLWITPLRALAADSCNAIQSCFQTCQIAWTVELRTADTKQGIKARQKKKLPTVLITTPESLSVMLSWPQAEQLFGSLRCVVCDELHEMMGSKRGTQVELAIARLRRFCFGLLVWGLSATLGNLDQAADVLAFRRKQERAGDHNGLTETIKNLSGSATAKFVVISGDSADAPDVCSIIPATMERFPWAGHIGRVLVEDLVQAIDRHSTSLVFTNTRSQTEHWYQAILARRPDWAGQIALHHSSLDTDVRLWVEDQLRAGGLRCVICTSSLDLGVDFPPVKHVFQVGSPKGVARLLQRAGRSGHQPGTQSSITCVPTHALELIEIAAARDAISSQQLESRVPPQKPLDVLCQHILTIASADGFEPEEFLKEVRSTYAYRNLTDPEWEWCLQFLMSGGQALAAYPEFRKLQAVADGRRLQIADAKLAKEHRMSIGTITADAVLRVQYVSGRRIGTIEESFIDKLKPGDCFVLSGRLLQFVRVHEMTVLVKKAASRQRPRIPRWMGGRMPLSSELAGAVMQKLQEASDGIYRCAEMVAVQPLLQLQDAWSRIPIPGRLLVESVRSREGYHLFFYPFAGRLVHEAIGALFAWRLTRSLEASVTISANDYGFEILSNCKLLTSEQVPADLLTIDNLLRDIYACLNASEMAKRRFREIARVSGLVFQGYPGQQKSARQLQSSSGLLFDVFANYDPGNLLFKQAAAEVIEQQFELTRLREVLERLQQESVCLTHPPRFTPFAFPLMVDRLRERLSSEQVQNRVSKMQIALEKEARRTMR